MRRWNPDPVAAAPATAPGERIETWLRDLRALRGVPLGQLVPDTRMLPAESLRFFALDRGWLDALCDGALSLRGTGEGDAALRAVALERLGESTVTGFLLRSVAVWRWPEIEVRAYGDDDVELEAVRCDRPAPDVLLGLYAGTLRALTLSEPAQLLHFGLAPEAPKRGRRVVDVAALRSQLDVATPADFAAALVQRTERIRFRSER